MLMRYIPSPFFKQFIQPAPILFVCFIAVNVTVFAVIKLLTLYAFPKTGNELYLALFSVLFIAATFHVKMRDLPESMAILLKIVLGLFAIYLSFPMTIPAQVEGLADSTHFRLTHIHYLAPLLCMAGLWRPGIGVIGIYQAFWNRISMSDILGAPLSYTEFYPIGEVITFIVICAALLPVFLRIKLFSPLVLPFTAKDTLSVLEKVLLCALALHLSNYFYSGVAKWNLGQYPWDWPLHNQTWALALFGTTLGTYPLSFHEGLGNLVIEIFRTIIIPANFAIFIGQLLAIVGGLRIRWIILLTAFYDVTHIGIFLASGIFFYKWIIFNIAIIVALSLIKDKIIAPALTLIITGIIICAPLIFHIAYLGWWDLKTLNEEHIYAITNDGEEYRVPTNYWGSFSVHYAQTRVVNDKSEGFFPSNFNLYGILKDHQEIDRLNSCGFVLQPDENGENSVTKAFLNPNNKAQQNILLMHRYNLEKADENGRYLYDFHPHHIFSTPWKFMEFYNLDKRNIVAYKYQVNATCLDYKNGIVLRDVKKSQDIIIPVKEAGL